MFGWNKILWCVLKTLSYLHCTAVFIVQTLLRLVSTQENFPRDRNGQELFLVKLLRATHAQSLIEKALKNQLIN